MILPYCVYVLVSLKDGKTYVGYTTDLQQRLATHERGEIPSTAPRRPLRLIYCEHHHAMSDAKRREQYLKTTAGKAGLKRMIRDALADYALSLLAGCSERRCAEAVCPDDPLAVNTLARPGVPSWAISPRLT